MSSHILEKLTLGIDWEVFVNDIDTGFSAEKQKYEKILLELRNTLPSYGIGEDIDLLELRIGMTTNVYELEEKIFIAYTTAQRVAQKHGCVIVPGGFRYIDENPAGGHVHLGSFSSYEDIVKIHNAILPYVPAFIAISCSSPSIDGEFKSIRLRDNAGHCARPMTLIDVENSALTWGTDVCIKYPRKVTLEFRAFDSQIHWRMVFELGLLFALFSKYLANTPKTKLLKPNIYEYGLNRYNAILNGAAATFIINEKEIAVSELLLNTIIPSALSVADSFEANEHSFDTLKLLAQKKLCPADFIYDISGDSKDKFVICAELTRVFAKNIDFTNWLSSASSKNLVSNISLDRIFIETISKDTPLSYVYMRVPLPAYLVEQKLEKLISDGKIYRHYGKKNDILFDLV